MEPVSAMEADGDRATRTLFRKRMSRSWPWPRWSGPNSPPPLPGRWCQGDDRSWTTLAHGLGAAGIVQERRPRHTLSERSEFRLMVEGVLEYMKKYGSSLSPYRSDRLRQGARAEAGVGGDRLVSGRIGPGQASAMASHRNRRQTARGIAATMEKENGRDGCEAAWGETTAGTTGTLHTRGVADGSYVARLTRTGPLDRTVRESDSGRRRQKIRCLIFHATLMCQKHRKLTPRGGRWIDETLVFVFCNYCENSRPPGGILRSANCASFSHGSKGLWSAFQGPVFRPFAWFPGWNRVGNRKGYGFSSVSPGFLLVAGAGF